MEELLFDKLRLDDRIADCPYPAGVDLRPVLDKYGEDTTWRTLFLANDEELCKIPGYGSKTVHRLRSFMGMHVEYSFMDYISTCSSSEAK